ncbi:MAG: alpha/beta hydrolase [Euryarchaeota archaeon]|nr:alpha/beta hydrolase [Euryarchaeota archaeon]
MAERGSFVRHSYEEVTCGKGGDAEALVMRRAALEKPIGRVVVLHGLGDAPVSWFRCLKSALPRHELLLPAIPGAGRGPLPPGRDHLTHKETRVWLGDLLERILDETEGPVRLVGHSLGGWLMSRAVLDAPHILERCGPHILINTAGTWYDGVERERELLTPKTHEEVDELLSLLYADDPDLPIEVIDAMLKTMRSPSYQGLLRSTTKDDFLEPADLERLPEGMGLVWGEKDRLVPPEAFERLKEHLPAPRVVTLDDVGHAPHMEAPDRLAKVLEDLLDEETLRPDATVSERA